MSGGEYVNVRVYVCLSERLCVFPQASNTSSLMSLQEPLASSPIISLLPVDGEHQSAESTGSILYTAMDEFVAFVRTFRLCLVLGPCPVVLGLSVLLETDEKILR